MLIVSLLLLAVLITWTILMPGCQPKPQEAAVEPPAPVPQPESAGGETTVAAPTEFTWAEAPTLASIPNASITGMVNGEKFEAKTVRVKKGDSGPELEMSNGTADTPTGLIMDDTGVELRFPLAEGTTGQFTKALADDVDFDSAHGWYWYPQGGDKGPMSVNPTWACAVEVTEWTMQTSADDENVLGNIKGKVAVCFDDDSKSWVAGTFDCIYYKW